MSKSMTATEHAAFMQKVRDAVEYHLSHPNETRLAVAKRHGISNDSLRKYSVAWHPSRFSVSARPTSEVKIPKPRPPRMRRGLFAKLGERWVLPENYPSELRFSELRVLEYYE